MAYSASSIYAEQYFGDSTYYIKRHVIYIALAIAVTIPFLKVGRPWFWRLFGIGAYLGSMFLLLLVLLIGRNAGGAQRWIQLGPITIQPSEIAKLAVVLVLALWMSKYEKRITSTHRFGGNFKYGVLGPGVIIGIICCFVMLEKHISGFLIIGMIGIAVMFMGGTKIKWLLLIGMAVALAAVGLVLVSDYAQNRVQIWLDIESMDPLGLAWQTLQGLYAIGSGGLFGVGLGNSRQKFGYVSEPQNDFIFAIICEELGFFGALLVVVLFAMFMWRGFKIASKAPDRFSALVVYGLVIKVILQVVLNIAVVTNSMPNTGISLPFFSSGGTSLALQIFEVGIILSISRFSYQKR
jgi:cell division protein FtsW